MSGSETQQTLGNVGFHSLTQPTPLAEGALRSAPYKFLFPIPYSLFPAILIIWPNEHRDRSEVLQYGHEALVLIADENSCPVRFYPPWHP